MDEYNRKTIRIAKVAIGLAVVSMVISVCRLIGALA